MSVLINGSPTRPFKMERGLRQGDPLSPFLFVLVVDVLHRMISEAVRNGRITPLFVGRDNIELSHLQFADDTVLFYPPEEETIKNYKRLLRCFELMSGLAINFDKSSLIPINCDQQWVRSTCNLLGCKEATLLVCYLGIPLGANPRLIKTWNPIIDKVEEKLSLWKSKILNKAGKLVLIKAVLCSLSVYYLSLYKMPKVVAEKLISLQRRFLWSKEDGRNGMALVSWDVVQTPKKLGGLGVGNAMVRNTALLFKWWWRFSKEECPLWKKVVCSCNNLSPNKLLSSQTLPAKGGPWKDICQLQIKEQHIRDKMITDLSMEVLQAETLPEDIASYSFTKTIWKGLVPPRVELLAWFVLIGRVNTKERLCRLGIVNQEENMCVLCNKDVEYIHHLFLGCEFSWQVWCVWLSDFGRPWSVPGSLKEHFQSWTRATNRKEERKKWFISFFSIVWNIWLSRMWEVMFECHKLQFQIISVPYNNSHAKIAMHSELHRQITSYLEDELLFLSSSLTKWIGAQKSYLEAISGWLNKCVSFKQKSTRKRRKTQSELLRDHGPPIYATCIVC
ncbi:uncharacterized protein LOC107646370 [Arachis ipaensis]|uniref:uncharacterized protein LOC107646370 n=1 Tax=Arachis ipaensis TaxID=130454 RepID=UPI0007AF2AFC|nr:uncharacterized protein LOC107646370 [Arachis ipaensis]